MFRYFLLVALSTVTALRVSNYNNIFSSLISPKRKNSNAFEIDELKKNIKLISRGKNNGINCSPTQRQKISEYVSVLERNNPVRDIASSSLLDGNWKLVYTTNEGPSAGKRSFVN